MAKDPAVLWYWADWNSGTVTLSRFHKGCYMDLLHAQFNSGHLSLEEIKTILGSDFGQSWATLQKKFKQDEHGLFFNERAELEKKKREKFVDHQRENGKKGGRPKNPNKTHGLARYKPNENPLENINENEDENTLEEEVQEEKLSGSISGGYPGPDDIPFINLGEVQTGAVIQLFKITKQTDVTADQVNNLFEVFKAQQFTGKRYYNDIGDIYSHFINWSKNQKIDNGTKKQGSELRGATFRQGAREYGKL